MESLPFRGGQRDLDRLGRALGPIAIQKVASRKWWFSVTRSAACFLHVSTGSSESRHLQAARAECRLVLVAAGGGRRSCARSAERRVGKECVSTRSSRWSLYH